jgi:hypothetical protein
MGPRGHLRGRDSGVPNCSNHAMRPFVRISIANLNFVSFMPFGNSVCFFLLSNSNYWSPFGIGLSHFNFPCYDFLTSEGYIRACRMPVSSPLTFHSHFLLLLPCFFTSLCCSRKCSCSVFVCSVLGYFVPAFRSSDFGILLLLPFVQFPEIKGLVITT